MAFLSNSCEKESTLIVNQNTVNNVSSNEEIYSLPAINGVPSYDSELAFVEIYQSLEIEIDDRFDEVVDGSGFRTDSLINAYLDSLNFDEFSVLDNFGYNNGYTSAFEIYYDSLLTLEELGQDSLIDLLNLPTYDPILLAMMNSDFEYVIGDSLINIAAMQHMVCWGRTSCCVHVNGNRSIVFPGSRRVKVSGTLGPIQPLAPVIYMYTGRVKSERFNSSSDKWENRRENLFINQSATGRTINCSGNSAITSSKSRRNNHTVVRTSFHIIDNNGPFFFDRISVGGVNATQTGGYGTNQVINNLTF